MFKKPPFKICMYTRNIRMYIYIYSVLRTSRNTIARLLVYMYIPYMYVSNMKLILHDLTCYQLILINFTKTQRFKITL